MGDFRETPQTRRRSGFSTGPSMDRGSTVSLTDMYPGMDNTLSKSKLGLCVSAKRMCWCRCGFHLRR